MKIWQVDFYHIPSPQSNDPKKWKLVICDRDTNFVYNAECDSSQANAEWLEERLIDAAQDNLPDKLQLFRPQALGLLSLAAKKLDIVVEATRHTKKLKNELKRQYKLINPNYNPLAIDKPPPQPLPENIWGEQWQIASISAGDIINLFSDRPIPVKDISEDFLPINLGLGSNIPIPGIVVYGGKKSMILARWLAEKQPVFLNYIPTEVGRSGGFILETGLADRWVFNTFESQQAASVAQDYEQKKQASQGLHFLLIQPDDSGMTYTGFWLLKQED
ncbi:MAG: Tab2/Atab2 family RNA-binding protein [Pleurocapsa sp.]